MPQPNTPLGTSPASTTPTAAPGVLNGNNLPPGWSIAGAPSTPSSSSPAQNPPQVLDGNNLPPGWSIAGSAPVSKQTDTPAAPSALGKYADNLKTDTEGHAANIVQDITEGESASAKEKNPIKAIVPAAQSGLRIAGEVAGEVGDFFGETLKSAASAALSPEAKTALKSAVSSVAGTPAAKGVITAWNNFTAQHPDAAKNIGATINIAGLFGGEGASEAAGVPTAEEAAQATKEGVSTVATKTSDALGTFMKPKELSAQDVYEEIKPKMTPTEEAAAKAAGRGSTVKGKVVISPSDRDLEMAQYAKDAGVTPKQSYDEQIQTMKAAQKESATKVRAALQSSDGTWSRTNLTKVLNEVNQPLTIKADPQIQRLAKAFKGAILDLSANSSKNAEGILDLRQSVDDLIDKEFPKSVYTKDTPIGQYVRSVRQSLNAFAESKIPEGALPDGSTMSGELRRQSLLYDAIQNVADNAPKEGQPTETSLLGKAAKFAKKHPVITGAAAITADKAAKGLGIPGSEFLP